MLANDFIFGGILERFPELKLVCSEYEVAWIPGFMTRLDQIDENISRFHLPRLEMRASDYMRTRVWHGSSAIRRLPTPFLRRRQSGLWGSDFPHFRSIGLEAQSARTISSVPASGGPGEGGGWQRRLGVQCGLSWPKSNRGTSNWCEHQ